jgi:hypothetical protein
MADSPEVHSLEWLRAFEAALSVEGVGPEQATRVANILVPTRRKYPTRNITWADVNRSR